MIVLALPKPQDRLRPGTARLAKTGRAARELVGTFKSVARRRAVVRAQLRRCAERRNEELAQAGSYTCAKYLAKVLGADAQFVRSYASAFGRAAAKAYRELFATEPAQAGLSVIGDHPRLIGIAAYGPTEYAALEKAAATYARTAALIGAS